MFLILGYVELPHGHLGRVDIMGLDDMLPQGVQNHGVQNHKSVLNHKSVQILSVQNHKSKTKTQQPESDKDPETEPEPDG